MSIRQKLTKTINGAYSTTDADNGYRIICNSSVNFTITLHTATGRYNFELEIDNIGIGEVTVGSQILPQYTHAHIGNNGGTEWVVVVGGGNYELTKEKVENVLTGEISTHRHTLLQATGTVLGGIKAEEKTATETQEVKIDSVTGKLYVAENVNISGTFDYGYIKDTTNNIQDWGYIV